MSVAVIPDKFFPQPYQVLTLFIPSAMKAARIQCGSNDRYIVSVSNFADGVAIFVKEPATREDAFTLICGMVGELFPNGRNDDIVLVSEPDESGPTDLNTYYYPTLSEVQHSEAEQVTLGECDDERTYRLAVWPDLSVDRLKELFGE